MCDVLPKILTIQSSTGYSLYSVNMSISTQALEQKQLIETIYESRQKKGCNRSEETNCMMKEYYKKEDRYRAITQRVSRVTEDMYRE